MSIKRRNLPLVLKCSILNWITRPSENPQMNLSPREALGTCSTVGTLSNSIVWRTLECSNKRRTLPEQASMVTIRLVCRNKSRHSSFHSFKAVYGDLSHSRYSDTKRPCPQSSHRTNTSPHPCSPCSGYRRGCHRSLNRLH